MPTRIPERLGHPASGQRVRLRKAPTQARAAATVAAIVEAAARILEAAGHAGFSTNAVAERAGVSIGSLYQYFPRKEALLGALIARETAMLITEAEAALDAASGREGIRLLVRACVAHQFRRPALARLLDFEEARLPHDADSVRVAGRFGHIVEQVLQRPDLATTGDLAIAAGDVAAIIKGMIDAAGAEGRAADLEGRVGRAVFGYLAPG